ncbi:MAG: 2,3-bisphosphoglycerate-dependent phosphoglycerate mutase [Pelagibacteraceae bacterium]|nr:2,3-bisphosphoglycerate-dependent phosphoglycerate mutase [Pelagibacteraceae bacterium]|tara:strand:+ start:319 stop:942 length:624 start_codon:yes stop_codon:yes gene_type:complete
MKNILLIRHGQSEWNKLNLFTGFKNVELSEEGILEAKKAADLFIQLNLSFDIVFTSVLNRAQKTANIILDKIGQLDDLNSSHKIISDSALNERDYGELTGLNKKETANKYGDEQVHKWRRGYSDRPPGGESLEDVVSRVSKYFHDKIKVQIEDKSVNNILIAAHGNSLRALLIIMEIYKVNEINKVELSTGIPLHIIFENSIFKIKD